MYCKDYFCPLKDWITSIISNGITFYPYPHINCEKHINNHYLDAEPRVGIAHGFCNCLGNIIAVYGHNDDKDDKDKDNDNDDNSSIRANYILYSNECKKR